MLGLLTSSLGRRTFLPRVTLLLIFGVIIGKDLLDIIPSVFSDPFEIIADMALYKAKNSGQNMLYSYSPDLEQS